ncbi:hypothetical protein PFISCL1PPCAC_19188, partial [Pristionchus fissidentatus]
LDIPSRLKFRVNRRIKRVELETKNKIDQLNAATTNFSSDTFSFSFVDSNGKESIVRRTKLENLIEGLRVIGRNTKCHVISVGTSEDATSE